MPFPTTLWVSLTIIVMELLAYLKYIDMRCIMALKSEYQEGFSTITTR
jgi:hypothetical protein